ncbi:MAG: tryptophan synthase subunit alpha [Gammaproteobacteria bacterium]|nr:tryptophan synthase subunit alpha [Gammaproteobacteria bacterium]NNJ48933.1 tryptophan synthase subunit alpha [Gammaproteobacteria bacterium]
MSRLAARFAELKAQNTGSGSKAALIPYVMTADPVPEITLPLMHAMVAAGADIIELGAPFSDPMADGPVIQAASERSLAHDTSLHDVFSLVSEFRKTDDSTPIVMMGYLNPIEVMGYDSFAQQASASGIDGVITVDMPPVEAEKYVPALKSQGLDPVFLLAPTSTEERVKKLAGLASGFVYYVSLKGVTGAATLDVGAVEEKVAQIRKFIDLPIGVGFGISDAESAAKVSRCSDAVVVGSAIVKKMTLNSGKTEQERSIIIKEISDILSAMRAAMDAA